MTRLLTTTALALALVAPGGIGAALAQETGGTTGVMTTTPRAKTDDAVGTQGNTTETGDVGGLPESAGASSWGERTGGDMVGQTVYGANGEEIGEVSDIVSRQGGSSPEALVGVGGFLGIGERDVAIPLDRLQMQGDRLTTTMTKDELTAMQPYESSGYQPWDRSRRLGDSASSQ
jgi:hypothetical protein